VPHVDDSMNLNVDESTIHNDLIVQSVDIKTKSTFYAGAAGASAMDQPKVNSNFHPLVTDPVFDDVNISIPGKVVENSVDIKTKSTFYAGAAGASAMDQPKVNSNFHPLVTDPVFDDVNISIPVVEYYARNNWAKHSLKRIMMNFKGFFFFKFDSRAVLEAVLKGGPWLIRKSPIILKKWSMDTKLLKKELSRISIWVKLHDVAIQVFEENGISLIATFIGKPIMLDSYISSMCNDSRGRSSFARCLIEVNSEPDLVVVSPPIVNTSNVVTPTVEKTNDGFQTMSKKKKMKCKSKSTNGGQFAGRSVKQNVRYEPKAITSAPNKGASNVGNPSTSSSMLKTTGTSSKKDNISTSKSYSVLNEEEAEEEDVENVYYETANLFTKTGGSSSFTAVVG
nr:hypothetical protein [Tanacetum cinerariifolium]